MASESGAMHDFVMRRYPGVIPAPPDALYPPRDVRGFEMLDAKAITDLVSHDWNVTHMVNVVSKAWPYALKKLKCLLKEGKIVPEENIKIVVPDISDDETESVFHVDRNQYTKVFENAGDIPFVRSTPDFLVRVYAAPQETPAIDALEVANAVLFDGKFEFKNVADKSDRDYQFYLMEARAKNRKFVKLMRPIYLLAKSMAAYKLYINDLSGVYVDEDSGRTCVSGFEFLASSPTMDIDFVSAFVLYAHLSAPYGKAPDYSFLDDLYSKSPRKDTRFITMYPSAFALMPDSERAIVVGGGRSTTVAWAALAAVTLACSLFAPLL